MGRGLRKAGQKNAGIEPALRVPLQAQRMVFLDEWLLLGHLR